MTRLARTAKTSTVFIHTPLSGHRSLAIYDGQRCRGRDSAGAPAFTPPTPLSRLGGFGTSIHLPGCRGVRALPHLAYLIVSKRFSSFDLVEEIGMAAVD